MSTTIPPPTSKLSSPSTLNNPSQTLAPKLIYGTAWKKERTADLVYLALKSGFRGVDTAAQPKHYREDLVGEAIRRAIGEGIVGREDLFIQTKFTPPSGQDHSNMPYSLSSPLPEKIHSSISSSLSNFTFPSSSTTTSSYLDVLVMHSPMPTIQETLEAWKILSGYVEKGQIKGLGISNTALEVLERIWEDGGEVKPCVVQNRFYPSTAYEVPLRTFCRSHGIIFQSFWTLTGNPSLVRSSPVFSLSKHVKGEEKAIALYSLVLGLESVSVLDGTTREEHMKGDLEGVEAVGKWAEGEGKEVWEKLRVEFKGLVGDV